MFWHSLYLAMNARGRLYGERDRNHDNALFAEHPDKVGGRERKFECCLFKGNGKLFFN